MAKEIQKAEKAFTWARNAHWLIVVVPTIATAVTGYFDGWPLTVLLWGALSISLLLAIGLECVRNLAANRRLKEQKAEADKAQLDNMRDLIAECRKMAALYDPNAVEIDDRQYLRGLTQYALIRPHLGNGFIRLMKSRTIYINQADAEYTPLIGAFLTELDHIEFECGLSRTPPKQPRAVGPKDGPQPAIFIDPGPKA